MTNLWRWERVSPARSQMAEISNTDNSIIKDFNPNQGSAMGWDETGIPVPGYKIPGWDRDRDEFLVISGIRDGTGMSFWKPGRDRDAPLNPGIPVIPDLIEFLGK